MPHHLAYAAPARLEIEADRLLRSAHSPGQAGARTVRQLARKCAREAPFGLEPPECAARSDTVEELRMIGRLTPLSPAMRLAYELWVEGATVDEIARAIGRSRAQAARTLRSALIRCWLLGPLSFGAFSKTSIYRAPASMRQACRCGSRCQVCAAPLWDDYERRTCGSPWCAEVDRRRRALDRRSMGRQMSRGR